MNFITLFACIGSVCLAVAGVVFVRHRVANDTLRDHHDVAAAIIGVMGTLYAVLVAFTVIIVWTHYTDASNAMHAEATHAGDLARLTATMGAEDDMRVRPRIAAYLSSVLNDEWPSMSRGEESMAAEAALNAIWVELRGLTPGDQRKQMLYREAIDQLQAVSDSRRERLASLHDDVPTLMWLILIGGGSLVVTFTYLFGPERIALHALMVAALATLIASSLFLIYELDNPFSGWQSVNPTMMQRQLEHIQAEGAK